MIYEHEWPDRSFVRQYPTGQVDEEGNEVCREVTIVLKGEQLLILGDLMTELQHLPALIGLVGDLIAEWQFTADVADADYRAMRGEKATELVRSQLGPREGPAEWKVEAAVNASAEFRSHKATIAVLQADLRYLEVYLQALQAKRSMLESLVKLQVGDRNGGVVGADLPNGRGIVPETRGPGAIPRAPRDGKDALAAKARSAMSGSRDKWAEDGPKEERDAD